MKSVVVAALYSPSKGLEIRIDDEARSVTFGAQKAISEWYGAFIDREPDNCEVNFSRVLLVPGREYELVKTNFQLMDRCALQGTTIASFADLKRLAGRCDVLLLHTPGQPSPALGRLRSMARLTNVAITSNHHTLSYPDVEYLLTYIATSWSHASDRIFAASESAASWMQSIVGRHPQWRGRIVRVPLGVSSVRNTQSRATARKSLKLPRDEFVIGSFGRISSATKASLEVLLACVALLRRQGVAAHLLIAGSNPESEAERLSVVAAGLGIAKHLTTVANPPDSWNTSIIQACDVLCSIPDNVQESFGLVPLEAMLLGVPTVVSDWDGYRSVAPNSIAWRIPTVSLRPESDLILDEVLDDWFEDARLWARSTVIEPGSLRRTLQWIAANRSDALARASGGRAWVERTYTWTSAMSAHWAAWAEAANTFLRKPASDNILSRYEVLATLFATQDDQDVLLKWHAGTVPNDILAAGFGTSAAESLERDPEEVFVLDHQNPKTGSLSYRDVVRLWKFGWLERVTN